MKKIKVEEMTPYHKSIKWDIHNNYFHRRGNEAWKTREVPFDITSNSQAAYQNAMVAYQIIENSDYKDGKPINILEIASGLGIFAINFIKRFKEICELNGKNYHQNLHYMFTDYSVKNLEDAKKNKYISKLKDENIIDFYILDALNPKEMKRLDGKKFTLEKDSITLAIANYLYCTLPIRILRKKNDIFYEKHIEMYLNVEDDVETDKDLHDILNQFNDNGLLNKIEEESYYEEINLDTYIKDDVLKDSFIELLKNIDVATSELPIGSCEGINKLMPFIKKTGALIISDKGYVNTDYMHGEHECFFSIHGNSFAHSLNFPLIDIYMNKKGFYPLRTTENLNSLQVMIIRKQLNDNVESEFINQFIDNNYNEDTHDYIDTGFKEKVEKNFLKALRYYLRALKYRKHDARVYFEIGSSYIGYGDYTKALDYLFNHPEDYLEEFDFDFEIGMAYDYLQFYGKALDHYNLSNEKFPSQKETLFNIGNVYHKMKNYVEAYKYYQKAISLFPDYEIAIRGISNLKDDMFNEWISTNQAKENSYNMEQFEKDFKNIVDDFNKALSTKVDLENLQKINEMFLQLAELFPDKPEIYSKLALINYVLGDIEKTNFYMNKSISMGGDNFELKELEKLLSGATI